MFSSTSMEIGSRTDKHNPTTATMKEKTKHEAWEK